MKEEILKMVESLCRVEADAGVLDTLCKAACRRLDDLLAEGVSAEDCAESYVTAAAWLIAAWIQSSRSWDGVTSLSAGDMTIHRTQGGDGRLEQRAMELMAPWMRDRNFVFRGVRG